MIGRIEDHVLLLQLERANEALSDRVEFLEDSDDDDDSCSCDCAETDITRIDERIVTLNDRMLEMADLIETLVGRVVQLEHNQNTLVAELVKRELERDLA